jgi:hypothetical protein
MTWVEEEERYAAMEQPSGWRAHHGEENSPWKNTAPSSFTAFSISDNTSIPFHPVAGCFG